MRIKSFLLIAVLATVVLCSAGVAKATEPLAVTCSVTAGTVLTGQNVAWTATVTGGEGTPTYSWTGTDGLSGTAISVNKVYSTVGKKTATIVVTAGTATKRATCQKVIALNVGEKIICIKAAINKRERDLGLAMTGPTGYTTALGNAYNQRGIALAAAYNPESSLETVKNTRKAAWVAFGTALKDARIAWQGARNSIWKTYRQEGNLCQAPSGTGDGAFSGYEFKGN